jgi:SAM-dependent methyltransferase
MDPTESLRRHYSDKFASHGPTSEGVDWGPNEERMLLRYDKMLSVIADVPETKLSLLDVGCGYGGLLTFMGKLGMQVDYTGIDVAENMIEWATQNQPAGKFLCGDALEFNFDRDYDYVVANGVLTQKLQTSSVDMDRFASKLIRRMFATCRYGIAFNVMSTKVNFFANNLYYRSPTELFAWCISEISPHIRIDHAYPLYEYTVYIYRSAVKTQRTVSRDRE